jgi:hypothetical protein
VLQLVVDAANVVGSVPDGWWRDRPGAARRLADRLVAALAGDLAAALGHPGPLRVHLVLEGAARRAEVPGHPLLEVVRAEADGDATIAALAGSLSGGGDRVLVVTADRGLRDRVRAAGAEVTGPGTLLDALPPA